VKPLRILLTADPIGGVWTYALDLARAFGRRSVDVVLATMGARLRPEQRTEALQLPNVELHESSFALEWMEDPRRDVDRAGDWLLEIADETEPDLIHLNGYAHATLPWAAPVVVVAHSCVLSWWRAVKRENAPNDWKEYQERVGAGLRAADFVVAPTQALLDELEEIYGLLPRSGVIPNGRDPKDFTVGVKEPFVFSAGRFWDEAKNLEALRAVAPDLRWPIKIAGSDGADSELVGLGHLTPAEMAEQLARASIYCLPARYEPFGLSALEAALSGCALVLGDIASLREVWADAALFVDPDNSTALARTLRELIENPAQRLEFSSRALARAQHFSLDRAADRYLALFSTLVRQPRPVSQVA
jgi:glycosyltransferase involved in cell wall biosynthesis